MDIISYFRKKASPGTRILYFSFLQIETRKLHRRFRRYYIIFSKRSKPRNADSVFLFFANWDAKIAPALSPVLYHRTLTFVNGF